MRWFWAALFVAFSIPFSGALADQAGVDCSRALGGLTFAQIDLNMARETQYYRGQSVYNFSKDAIKDFWRKSWPVLVELAAENQTTVENVFSEYLVLFEISAEATKSIWAPKFIGELKGFAPQLLAAIRRLGQISDPQALKSKQWRDVDTVFSGAKLLADFASAYERDTQAQPSFDPSGLLPPPKIFHVFDVLENITLDYALLLEQRALPEVQDSAKTLAAPVDKLGKDDKLHEGSDLIVPQQASLARTLADGEILHASTTYTATTVFGRQLNVSVSQKIIDDFNGGHRQVLSKLLRGIITGRGDTTGIKTLFDIGPRIVELKARIRSHKRILGCLDGVTLELKEMIEIKETRAAYSNRIPHNYCKD